MDILRRGVMLTSYCPHAHLLHIRVVELLSSSLGYDKRQGNANVAQQSQHHILRKECMTTTAAAPLEADVCSHHITQLTSFSAGDADATLQAMLQHVLCLLGQQRRSARALMRQDA